MNIAQCNSIKPYMIELVHTLIEWVHGFIE